RGYHNDSVCCDIPAQVDRKLETRNVIAPHGNPKTLGQFRMHLLNHPQIDQFSQCSLLWVLWSHSDINGVNRAGIATKSLSQGPGGEVTTSEIASITINRVIDKDFQNIPGQVTHLSGFIWHGWHFLVASQRDTL